MNSVCARARKESQNAGEGGTDEAILTSARVVLEREARLGASTYEKYAAIDQLVALFERSIPCPKRDDGMQELKQESPEYFPDLLKPVAQVLRLGCRALGWRVDSVVARSQTE